MFACKEYNSRAYGNRSTWTKEYDRGSMKKAGGAVTIKDVAREAGVGAMTVSRVINSVAGSKVSHQTAERVRKVIDRMGYVPNHVARSLRGQRSNVIGLITTDIGNPFWAACARGVEREARKHGYATILLASDESPTVEAGHILALRGRRIDGLLLIPSAGLRPETWARDLGDFPVVALDRPIEGMETDSVLIHNDEAAYQATKHLLWHGHRRIAFIGYCEHTYTVQERMRGYRRAVQEAGLEPLIRAEVNDPVSTRDLAMDVLSGPEPVTGIFGMNNLVINGILQAAMQKGLQVGKDLAVTGFEDFEWASFMRPALTLVRQPGEEMGRKAAELLFARLAGNDTAMQSVLLDTELVIRESCGCGGN